MKEMYCCRLLKVNPTYPVYNEDGSFYQKSKDVRNPVAMINLTDDKTETDRVLANITGTLDLWKDLKYKMNVAFDEMKASRKVTQDAGLIYLTDKGTVDINNVEGKSFLIENYLTYNLISEPNTVSTCWPDILTKSSVTIVMASLRMVSR